DRPQPRPDHCPDGGGLRRRLRRLQLLQYGHLYRGPVHAFPGEGTMITVQFPAGNQANVIGPNNNGSICAQGTAQQPKNLVGVQVMLQVYQVNNLPNPIAATPPAGATPAMLNGPKWSAPLVPGCACAAAAPLPSNTLAVWAAYPGLPG